MSKEIKQKIVLEGEQKYNQALKDAQRNLRTLKSELKAETAELGKNATEQQKAETRANSLRKQIAEQEKVVKTLREALAEVKEKYGENADEVAKWETKLNNARTTLANMKNEAATTTVATKSVADALDSIGSAAGSISGAIEDVFSGMIDRVTDAVGQVWELISETAAKANNWTDIAGYWGTDAQTIQQYASAVKASANNFEDLQAAVSKIVMGGKGKAITELLGVSDVNYENEWAYAMAVMDQLSTMSAAGANMTPIYEQIFGEKKGTKVMDLVNDWKQIQEMLPEFNGNETGYGMSDEELSTMNDLWLEINKVEEKWADIKSNIAAGFGKVSLDLLVNVEGTLDGIADYLNATDDAGKQAALEKIKKNVEEFFTKLGEVIRDSIHILKDVGMSLQESDDPLTSAIGDILVNLSNALQWMVDHADEVKKAFETIFGIWLVAKLTAVAGKLASIVLQIQTIQAFKGLGSAAGAAGASSAASAAGSSAAGSGLGGFASAMLSKVLPVVAGAGLVVADSLNNHGNDEAYQTDANGNVIDMTKYAAEHDKNGHTVFVARDGDYGGSVIEIPGYKPQEIVEDVDLEDSEGWKAIYSDQQRNAAVQDWWDAFRAGADDEESALAWMQEVFGDDFGDVWDRIIQKLDETENQAKLEDLPEDWWRTTGSWGESGSGSGGTADENGITSSDLQGFRGLPAQMQSAVQKGVSGMKVEIDGQTAGRILAPYVSEEIAKSINY